VKVTYRWLEEFVDIPWSPIELAEKLTLSGSEVESVESVKSIFQNVVVGHVKSCKLHSKAQHLKICKLDIGDRVITVVCGAPNIKTGQNIVVALPGSKLPSGIEINVAKIRGVDSYGMICSESELGFSDVASEIMELPKHHKPGEQFDPGHFSEDSILDIFINPNRPDCMSIYGIAREIAALSGQKIRQRPVRLPWAKALEDNDFKITIKDEDKCQRYCGAIITGVRVRPSPYEIQQRLTAVGIRPVNNIVDATNYCLIEWGQPLHAFDLKLLSGKQIIVRTAKKGQKFVTLDNETRTLNEEVLLICDREKAVAIGGIMGGVNSEITPKTTDILIESAYFKPQNIQRSSKYLNLTTEASHRFERGLDPEFCLEALKRVSDLIIKCSLGQLHKPFYDVYPKKIKKKRISLRTKRLNSILGTNFNADKIEEALNDLEIKTSRKNDIVKAVVPTFRPDLIREIDLIEEVARIIGLENIEPEMFAKIPLRNVCNLREHAIGKLRTYMTEFGFMESYTYSMIDSKFEGKIKEAGEPIFLKNPISPELSMMRPSLIPSLLNVALHNYNRGVENLRVFELGNIFNRRSNRRTVDEEKLSIGAVMFGQRVPPSWDHLDTPSDFFTIKGILESLFRKILLDKIELISYDSPYLEESNAAVYDGKQIGFCGRYKNSSLFIEFPEPVFIFEIDVEPIIRHIQRKKFFEPYSKYPPAKRDLAFVIPDSLPVQNVMDFIRKQGEPLLEYLNVDDVYRGKQIEFDRRSIKFSMKFFSKDRNLLDDEVDRLISRIIDAVRKKFSIDIRR